MRVNSTCVIVNPIAGGHRALAAWRRLEPAAHREWPDLGVVITERPGHATLLARQAADAGCQRVVVVGGDGTIQEVVTALLHTETVIGVVPAGTGNDFSRTHLIPRDHEQALAIAMGPFVRRVDVGTVNGRPYVNVAGVGFDAEVCAWVKPRTRLLGGGPPLYVAGVFRQLLGYRAQSLNFALDGETFREKCFLIAVGNGRYYGGGMKMCPAAQPDDGWLDVVIGGDLGKLETIRLLSKVYRGDHVTQPKVRTVRARVVSVAGGPDLAVQADGEPVGRLPAEFGLCPGALCVAVPEGVGGAATVQLTEAGATADEWVAGPDYVS